MKINNKDLQRLYKAFVRQKIPSSRKDCPPFKKIIKLFSNRLSEKQKTQIIDHITNCYYCTREFEFILHSLRYKLKLNTEINKLLLTEKEIYAIKKRAEVIVSDLEKRQKFPFLRLSWKYVSILLAGTVIITFSVISFKTNLFRIPEESKQRSENITQIKLIEPVGEKHSKTSISFKWSEIKNSNYYILELYDEALVPIWKSKKIFKNYFIFPRKLSKNLTENRVYFWMVTAYFMKGRKIESPLEEFTLTD